MWIGEEDPIYDQIVSFQENKCSYLYKNIVLEITFPSLNEIKVSWGAGPKTPKLLLEQTTLACQCLALLELPLMSNNIFPWVIIHYYLRNSFRTMFGLLSLKY